MPNLITHTMYIEDVIEEMQDKDLQALCNAYPNEYRIGTNGPDYLFFHNVFPLFKKHDLSISKLGTRLHREQINKFYESVIKTYHNTKESKLKEAMKVYIIGHYLHWQLDSVMHPYVVYFTGFGEKDSASHHHRFESMMDTINLKRWRDKTLRNYKTSDICICGEYSEEAIASLYVPAIKDCFSIEITNEDIKKALHDWHKAQRWLYDPKGWKFRLVQFFEVIVRKKWMLSGNIVRVKVDHYDEVLHTSKAKWKHPVSGEVYHDSHDDRIEIAKQEAKKGIPLLQKALDEKEMDDFLNFLDNKTYANGIKGSQKRKYKDDIYNEKGKN